MMMSVMHRCWLASKRTTLVWYLTFLSAGMPARSSSWCHDRVVISGGYYWYISKIFMWDPGHQPLIKLHNCTTYHQYKKGWNSRKLHNIYASVVFIYGSISAGIASVLLLYSFRVYNIPNHDLMYSRESLVIFKAVKTIYVVLQNLTQ